MKIRDFKLECYFGKYEFTAPYLLTQSDCESMHTEELLAMEPGAKEAYLKQWLGYTQNWGDQELRKLIAGLYRDMDMENVLVFHGAQEAIFGYMNILLNPGDHMITMYPNYQSAYEVANAIPGCSVSRWCLHDDGEKWVIDFDELEALILPNTKLLAVNTPNNPTGYTFTNEEIEKLCNICRKHDIYLFSDEVYKGLELDGQKRDWIADHYEKAVSLGVMSKAYGLAGLRIGWLVSKDVELLERAVKFKYYMSICDSAPSEFLSKVALKHSDELLKRSRDLILENLKYVDAFFEKHKKLFGKRPITCGPVAFHKLLIDMPVKEFCQMAVDRKGVLLLPADIYDMDGQYFRMGYGRKGVPEALHKFEEFLAENGFC